VASRLRCCFPFDVEVLSVPYCVAAVSKIVGVIFVFDSGAYLSVFYVLDPPGLRASVERGAFF
jgi:hypothetical protein